jgi:hypothetical protein
MKQLVLCGEYIQRVRQLIASLRVWGGEGSGERIGETTDEKCDKTVGEREEK